MLRMLPGKNNGGEFCFSVIKIEEGGAYGNSKLRLFQATSTEVSKLIHEFLLGEFMVNLMAKNLSCLRKKSFWYDHVYASIGLGFSLMPFIFLWTE